MACLPNPESQWERPADLQSLDRGAVAARIGPTEEPLELMAGGLANLNIRVGERRLLRIYRRDAAELGKEAWLLDQPWRGFRVPKVLEIGADFLLLEFVPSRYEGVAQQGAAVGRALAEIHQQRHRTAGFLRSNGTVGAPMTDLVAAATAHLEALADYPHPALREEILAMLTGVRDELRTHGDEPVLLHGDFKAANLRLTGEGELLVLDWEFAYAGPALMDVGQLFRWQPAKDFEQAFVAAYRAAGGTLPDDWCIWASVFDLINLGGLLAAAAVGSRRAADLASRVATTARLLGETHPWTG